MSRRKYQIIARMNERDYPHLVELALPPGGFQFYVRYCFGNPAHADEFCHRFGGERVTAKPS